MRRPTLALAVAINRTVRGADESFGDPDDLERVERALAFIDDIEDVLPAAGVLAFRIARAQGFGEGNKRAALLLARWLLDRNGFDGGVLLRPDDHELADLLVKAAAGRDVQGEIVRLIVGRT